MNRPRPWPKGALLGLVGWWLTALLAIPSTAAAEPVVRPNVLILYHGGVQAARADALTHATTPDVNVERIAQALEEEFLSLGARVVRKPIEQITSPGQLRGFEAILLGSPVWFSNMSWPMKRFFDTTLYQVYVQESNRLQGTLMSAFCTVMESGASGPRALESIQGGMEHLSDRVLPGLVIQTSWSDAQWRPAVRAFAQRIQKACRREQP